MKKLSDRLMYYGGILASVYPAAVQDLKHVMNLLEAEEKGLLRKVEQGEWKSESGMFFPIYRCSECNCASALGKTKFCPNCGSNMRKELENE